MADTPEKPAARQRQSGADAPEAVNMEQRDWPAQAQTVAAQAKGEAGATPGLESAPGKAGGSEEEGTQDIVDQMRQMKEDGAIDMAAYAGEPNHDDNPEKYSRQSAKTHGSDEKNDA